jgi:MerR family redox-sensitive transcriptional activator SoxR
MTEELLSIDKVVRLSGVASSTLRYYERCALLDKVVKRNGRRHYAPSILHRLSLIKFCQSMGFSLAEIRDVLHGPFAGSGAWRDVAVGRRDRLLDEIERLTEQVSALERTLRCDCDQLSQCDELSSRSDLTDGRVPRWVQGRRAVPVQWRPGRRPAEQEATAS